MTTPASIAMNWRSGLVGLVMICALVCLAQLYFRRIERPATRWLIAFVLAAFATAIPTLIGFAGGAYDVWPDLTFLPTQFPLWFGPLLYFHARALMVGDRLGRSWWWLLPGGLHAVYQIWAFIGLGDFRSKWAFNDAIHEPYIVPAVIVGGSGLAAAGLYEIRRLRARYLEWLQAHRSDSDDFRPVWLKRFIVMSLPLAALWAVEGVMGRVFALDYFQRFWVDFALLFVVYLLAVEALAQIRSPYPKMPTTDDPTAPTDFSDPSTPARDWRAEGTRLHDLVVRHGWYLEPSVSLQDLSRRVGSNQTYVSRALNQGLETNFSRFINELRVEHAKALLDAGKHSSMLDLALESGFGSKASFNRAFKRHTGMTPTAYKDDASRQRRLKAGKKRPNS